MASVMGIDGPIPPGELFRLQGRRDSPTKTTAKGTGSRGINVNAVCTGFIQNCYADELSDNIRREIASQIPLNRLGTPEERRKTGTVSATDDSSYITGQVINVDGGMVM